MRKSIVYFLCIIATMCSIFMFSAQNFENTMETSNVIAKPIESTIKKNTKKTFKDEKQEKNYWQKIKGKVNIVVRKGAHGVIFGLLGLFTLLFLNSLNVPMADAIVSTMAFCLLYALGDELHQRFIDGRNGRFTDVCIDGFGSWIGVTLVYVGLKIKACRAKTKGEKAAG